MKHISKNRVGALPPIHQEREPSIERFHSLSYYLLGGIDLSGRELDNTATVEFDTEEQLAELREAGFSSAPFGDPREDKFSLVAKYGSYEADKIASKSGNPTQTAIEPGANS